MIKTDVVAKLAEAMHEEWLEVMAEQGYHSPTKCTANVLWECERCREGLVSWADLRNEVKEVNRRGARAMLKALNCVNSKGEVFVPDVRAAVELIETVQVNTQEPATESICGKALRALTGGTDEG